MRGRYLQRGKGTYIRSIQMYIYSDGQGFSDICTREARTFSLVVEFGAEIAKSNMERSAHVQLIFFFLQLIFLVGLGAFFTVDIFSGARCTYMYMTSIFNHTYVIRELVFACNTCS